MSTGQPTFGAPGAQKEGPKFKVIDSQELSQFIGKPRSEVLDYIRRTYGPKIPDSSYGDKLRQNPDQVPEELKDGKKYFFMGSTNSSARKGPTVRCFNWETGEFRGSGNGLVGIYRGSEELLESKWSENDRVLVLG
ncbi:MAG: hypothetical protein NTX14_01035 [Candidatus Nealsonbacteria bacterium]|nr:hypothetical protein [Candidatus Nealsonbacteria bacterium]